MNNFNSEEIDLNVVNPDTLDFFLSQFEDLIDYEMDCVLKNIDENKISSDDKEDINFLLHAMVSSSTRLLDCISFIRKQKIYLNSLLKKENSHA